MHFALFSVGSRLRRVLHTRFRFSVELQASQASIYYSTNTKRSSRPKLATALWPLGHPSISLVPELDRWAKQGNRTRATELQHVIRELRRRKKYRQALEVSKWMKDKSNVLFHAGDEAVQLDLIGHVHGLATAESHFNSMEEKNRTEKAYGALLNCYVRERLVDKALSHMQKIKEMGFASGPLVYNDIMRLYTNTGQHEKVPSVFSEMKDNGILPDNFSYRICIDSYGTRSDIDGMEKLLEEMEHQPHIVVDWNTYTVVANIYIRSGLPDKAISALKKAEERLEEKHDLCYNHLITLYGQLGEYSEMQRIWELQRLKCVKFHYGQLGEYSEMQRIWELQRLSCYMCMLGHLVKLEDLEKAEVLLKEWESSGNAFDFRVPNILLVVYCQKGLLEKAEAMLYGYLKKGKTPPSHSWGLVARGYEGKGEMAKACEFMTNALCVYSPNAGWSPNAEMIKNILHYLSNEGSIKDVETFVSLLKNVMPMDRESEICITH